MSLVEHLEDLRSRLIRSVVILTIAWVFAWVAHDPVYNYCNAWALTGWPKELKYVEAFLSVTDAFMLKLKVSFYFGLVVALPLIVNQVWGFISPGLKEKERKPFRIIGPLSFLLFALGCFFCWLVIPVTIEWFASIALQSYPTAQIHQEPGRLVFFILNMMLAFGVGFQLPLVVFFLAKVGILPAESLMDHWRHAVVVIFFLAAVLTPSADPISMLMMAIPLCILFVISVIAVRATVKQDPNTIEQDFSGAEERPPVRTAVPFNAALEEDMDYEDEASLRDDPPKKSE